MSTLFPGSHSVPDPFFKSTTLIPPFNFSFRALVSASGSWHWAWEFSHLVLVSWSWLLLLVPNSELCFEVLASSLIVCCGVGPSFLEVFSSIFFSSSPPASSSQLFSSSLKLSVSTKQDHSGWCQLCYHHFQPPLDVLGGEVPLLHHVLGGPGHCIDHGLVVVDLSHAGLTLLDHLLLLIRSQQQYLHFYLRSIA